MWATAFSLIEMQTRPEIDSFGCICQLEHLYQAHDETPNLSGFMLVCKQENENEN